MGIALMSSLGDTISPLTHRFPGSLFLTVNQRYFLFLVWCVVNVYVWICYAKITESTPNQQRDRVLYVRQRAFILTQVRTWTLHESNTLARSESFKLTWGEVFFFIIAEVA